jgi:hypothetical protein
VVAQLTVDSGLQAAILTGVDHGALDPLTASWSMHNASGRLAIRHERTASATGCPPKPPDVLHANVDWSRGITAGIRRLWWGLDGPGQNHQGRRF